MSGPPKTIEQVLALHPWPEAYGAAPRLDWLWHFEVALSVDQLWPIIADSSRMNRALGVAEIKFEDRAGVRWGTSRPGGVAHEWVEVPWNWVAGQWIESTRIYERGFSKVVYAVFMLEPLTPERTRLSVYFGAVPRHLLGKIALSYGFPSLEKDFKRVLAQVSEQFNAMKPVLFLPPPEALSSEAETKLQEAEKRLKAHGLEAACVDRLLGWLRTGDEEDLYRIQIRERARAWQLDEQQLLRVALHATREAVLEISWDIICPHCRGVTEEVGALGGLTAKGACEVCELEFGTDAAESVEITFHVHPSIRAIAHRTFCSAEPATKQHIRLQRDLAPGAQFVVSPKLTPGSYRLRLHARSEYGFIDVAADKPAQHEWRASTLSREAVGLEPTLTLRNDSGTPQRFILEAARWSDHALRPGQLFSLQEYRDLFSEDYLSTDVQLAIGEQTILFTDIVGSTAMYAERGDPAAFMEVKNHFGEVFPVVARHRGAVVKTIGDAVMAAFSDPLDAVKASRDIHACFPPGRKDSDTRLRISLNSGPCIAVKLNTGVDYFGQTVNLAAKLQSLAESWQVAMSESVLRAPGVASWFEKEAVTLEALSFASKALREPLPVKRWTCFVE
ncbi:MAG: DUF5939 domain-containing protein [Archangium sp.]|nr:DUF5939 domain-containing protein [Archangium sp.]MDP3573498.1 DUF5939 domain-containing protein [Archangium sp.]